MATEPGQSELLPVSLEHINKKSEIAGELW
jgi:hypothetical protein